MRRLLASLGVVALSAVLVMAGSPAMAGEPLPAPVTPIPELPSNTIRMTPTTSGSWTATDWWKAVIWKAGQPGTAVATLPTGGTVATIAKPITPAVGIARGAAGGPLVGSFMGGFAIGTVGLEMYGTITGTDPFEPMCGTGFEGAAHVLYMGFMPDCTVDVYQPNFDVQPTQSPLVYGGLSSKYLGLDSRYQTVYCFQRSGTVPAGHMIELLRVEGHWEGRSYPGYLDQYCGAGNYSDGHTMWHQPVQRLRNTTTNAVVAQSTSIREDVQRTPKCRIGWEDGTTTTGTGTPYKEESQGLPLSAAGLGCEKAYVSKPGAGPDLLPSTIDVDSVGPGGAITTIAETDVPSMSPEQRKGLTTPANGRGLTLEKVVNGVASSCMTWVVDCAGWWDATSQGTTTETATGTYRCAYGGEAVSLAECGPYRQTFETPTSTPTITDPNGTPQPWPATGAASTPGTVAPGVTGAGACGAAWSWNPVDWVLNPLKCAFIPSEAAVRTSTENMQKSWEKTLPGKLPALVATMFAIPSLDGCSGPHVVFNVPWLGTVLAYDGYPMSACDPPMSGIAATARTIGAAVLIFYTTLGVIRRGSAVVNAPGLGGSSGVAA